MYTTILSMSEKFYKEMPLIFINQGTAPAFYSCLSCLPCQKYICILGK